MNVENNVFKQNIVIPLGIDPVPLKAKLLLLSLNMLNKLFHWNSQESTDSSLDNLFTIVGNAKYSSPFNSK